MPARFDPDRIKAVADAAARLGTTSPAKLRDATDIPLSTVKRYAKLPEVIDAAKRGTKASAKGVEKAVEKIAERKTLSDATEHEVSDKGRLLAVAEAEAWLATPDGARTYEIDKAGFRKPPHAVQFGMDLMRDRGRTRDKSMLDREAKEAEAKPATQVPTGTVRIIRVARPHLRVVGDDKADTA